MDDKFHELKMPQYLPNSSNRRDEWYVAVIDSDGSYYLHSDLKIRVSTHHDGVYLGWFKTEVEGMEARSAYYALYVGKDVKSKDVESERLF